VNHWLKILFILLLFPCAKYTAQENNLRKKTIAPSSDWTTLDTLTIYPNSFQINCKNQVLDKSLYEIDYTRGRIRINERIQDSIQLTYRVLPYNFGHVFKLRDTNQIFTSEKGEREKYLIKDNLSYDDAFGSSGIKKNGSISRGISFGNNQNVSLNSSLNLELSGEIAPNLKLMASITDNNIPIQPEGNTSKLQEFDQVFIQIYNDKFKLIAGDYWINKPTGYFLNYRKRGQGLSTEYQFENTNKGVWKTGAAVGLSKGKYARQIVQGVEGNQGPYRMKGNENEPFIVILSGTEIVYIDGKILTRGQENDYIINYNTAEITFTSRNSITKDVRIVVEFQYTDQSYARSLTTANASYNSKKVSFWINGYSEQDAKNQTLQQTLSNEQKLLLSSVGDSLQLASTFSVDSVGFLENQNVYKKIDSLGYQNVLVYSINPKEAIYQTSFSYVGANKGNYVFDRFNALGKIYTWIAPQNGIPQGEYEPIRLLVSPKQKQMVSAGVSYAINSNTSFETETALSKNDINTFSSLDAIDDQGYSNRTKLKNIRKLGKDSLSLWNLKSHLETEYLSRYFTPIEIYRSVEFDRDWNTRGKGYLGNQFSTTVSTTIEHQKKGNIQVDGARYNVGTNYTGYKSNFTGKWKNKGFLADWTSSYLSSKHPQMNNVYLRHKLNISQAIGKIRIGYKDDQEDNKFNQDSILTSQSFSFYDYQFYLANADSSRFNYTLFYRERFDKRSDSTVLTPVAKAKNIGAEFNVLTTKNQRFNFILNYRELKINNSTLLNQAPENTLLGRIDYDINWWKGAVTWNSFYEIGSGLELKKEFLYIKVNDGQGVYTWIDYNLDGVKDLNEFEVAQYVDQASYIRIFTPSNQYVKTYSNELNQGIFIKPERMWSNATGIRKVLSIFSDQARIRINRKTSHFDNENTFNPFLLSINDTSLISTTYNLRNTLFINRTSSIIGGEYIYQDNLSKSLLATGFDARNQRYHELNIRWNIRKVFLLESSFQQGNKSVNADYTTGRNYVLNYYFIKPALSYQPATTLRYTLDARYAEKKANTGETAFIGELTLRLKLNQAEKGSLQASVSFIDIAFQGVSSSALGFEMLESLKPGNNKTWTLSYQRSVSKKMQISIQYSGRNSENSRIIHAGGMEVRAFF
jgi:hypothetical protein